MRTHENDDELIRDGEAVRVPLLMMDKLQRAVARGSSHALHDGMGNAAGFKPGYVFASNASDAPKCEARAEYERGLTSAWQGETESSPLVERYAAGANTRDAAFDDYDEWLQNAWRGAR